jgi:Short C-terminal domain
MCKRARTDGLTHPSQTPPWSPALAAEIERLADRHACGILTDEEFRQAKQPVLT